MAFACDLWAQSPTTDQNTKIRQFSNMRKLSQDEAGYKEREEAEECPVRTHSQMLLDSLVQNASAQILLKSKRHFFSSYENYLALL